MILINNLRRIYSTSTSAIVFVSYLFANVVVLLTAAVDYVADYEGPTYFIPQPNNVSYQAGSTATLTCSVENLGNKFIVWRKTAEPHPISVGNMIYAPDTRYEVAFAPERREFNLVIRAVTQNDAGVYECQVSSRDKLVRHVLLRIEERPDKLPSQSHLSRESNVAIRNPDYTIPEILLSGNEYVNTGDTIRLVCKVTGTSDIPQDVDWFRNGHLLRSISNKILISKETSMARRKLDSVLEVRYSKLEDSGEYVCRNSEILIASQKVIVLNEGDSNMGKRGAGAEATSGQICKRQWWSLIILMFLAKAVTDIIVYKS
ncbi:hypothetical protein DPMN_114395 [Dreissena polymorpha]|uniref:Ig-like domain-containing protein n=1 Tax=Dreissena polymorpha TaxID=45954 RepID=A0A9D4KJT5_DREPO|nr:hypothetical protein DPMN_114395 [Dreissena polymorpha]